MNKTVILLALFGIILSPITATCDVTIPHTFQSGTIAKASEVNDNFNALKTAIDSLEQQDFDGRYWIPYSDSGALTDRNVNLLKYKDPNNPTADTQYFLIVQFKNTDGYLVSTNGSGVSYNYILFWVYVYTDNSGNITRISNWTEAANIPDANQVFIDEILYNIGDLSIDSRNDNRKLIYKNFSSPQQSVVRHRVGIYKLSINDEYISSYDRTYISSLLGEPMTVNGMTFDDIRVTTRFSSENIRYSAKNIGYIIYGDYKLIYYRVDGSSEGSLTGTPFESGGFLDGFFFSE